MKFIFIFLSVAGLACPIRALEPEAGADVPGPASALAPVLKDLGSGRITFVEGASVKISGSSQPAQTGDPFAEKGELETGASPVTEVTFGDGSVMRLGEKTKVSYSAKERIVQVAQGTVLFHSPTGNGGITLQGEKATGQVAGSTAIATQDSSGNFSFLLLEGSGAGSVSGGTAAPTTVGVGELTTLRSNSAEPPQVMEVQVEAVRDNSPLFQQIPSDLTSAEKIFGTADSQSDDIQNDLKLLSSLKDFELAQSDPEGVSLAMICGVGQDEIGAAKNILLRPVDTAAGTEELASASSSAPATVQAVIGGLNGLSGASSGLASASAVLSAVSPALQSAANSNDPKSLQAFTFAAVSAVAQGDPGAVQSIVSGLISAISGSPQAGDAATIVAAAAIVTASNFGESAMQAASAGAIAGALASGNPALVQAVNQGLANGTVAIVQGTVVAAGTEAAPADARQAEAEPLVAAVAPAGSGDGLAGTETAAGGEGDLSATETAAGGGGGADTQAPLAPVVTSPTPGLTTPI